MQIYQSNQQFTMKSTLKLLVTIIAFLIQLVAFAQAPDKFSYQAVIRNTANELISNQQVGVKISILQGSETGTIVYSETHTPTTNVNGLISLQVGNGNIISGDLNSINWSNGPYFIQTETDPNGGSAYSIMNLTQMMSVPYALYAAKSPDQQQLEVSITGDTLFLQNGGFVIIPRISAANNGVGQTGSSNHACGATNVHDASKYYGVMADQQGNVYKTITIGEQEWMAENLRTSIYRNGEPINFEGNSSLWNLNIGSWCFFENDPQYNCPYGKLYNWLVVADPRKVCPIGWHIPSNFEWEILTEFLGGDSIAGGKMKAIGSQYWNSPNTAATNESGFAALPGALRFESGSFDSLRVRGYYWTSNETSLSDALIRKMYFQDGSSDDASLPKKTGASLRCIKDE
jgi:uncharacterized protein (TIGR02145 family)